MSEIGKGIGDELYLEKDVPGMKKRGMDAPCRVCASREIGPNLIGNRIKEAAMGASKRQKRD